MDDKEREWAVIRTLFAGSRLIDAEKVKADTKGNEPMDEELFTEEVVDRLAAIEEGMRAFEDELVSQILRFHEIDSRFDEVGWRFYEVEKRTEELEKMLIAHRRFTIFALATLHVISLTIALWVFSLHGW